jgi:hypothetical protein
MNDTNLITNLEMPENDLSKSFKAVSTETMTNPTQDSSIESSTSDKKLFQLLKQQKEISNNCMNYLVKFIKKPLETLEDVNLGWQESLTLAILYALVSALAVLFLVIGPASEDSIFSYISINKLVLFFQVFILSLMLQCCYALIIFLFIAK